MFVIKLKHTFISMIHKRVLFYEWNDNTFLVKAMDEFIYNKRIQKC